MRKGILAVFGVAAISVAYGELSLSFSSGTSGSIFSSGVTGQGAHATIQASQSETWRGQTFVARVPNDVVAAGWYLSRISLYFDDSEGDRVFGSDDVWTVRIAEWQPEFDSDSMANWLAGNAGDAFAGFTDLNVIFEDTGSFASDTTVDRSRWLRFEVDSPDTYFLEGGKAYVVLFKIESPDSANFPARTADDTSLHKGSMVFQEAGQAPGVSNSGDLKIWIHGTEGTPNDGRDLAPQFDLSGDIELPKNWIAYEDEHASGFEPFGDGESLVGYTVTTDNDGLFEEIPVIDNQGVLRFKSQTGTSGSTTVSVYATDTGATNNQSLTRTFEITIRDREAIALHVDAESSAAFEAQDGLSWENAYSDLQDALADAFEHDEIWVAAGRYYPDQARAQKASISDNDEDATFTLIDGVKIYGGFDGSEADRSLRNPVVNVCILSGDIDYETEADTSNGGLVEDAQNDIRGTNSVCVVTGSTLGNALLDGFTITGGFSSSFSKAGGFTGAGELRNCLVQGNWGRSYGGINSFGPRLILTNTRLYSNSGNNVGGLNVYGADLDIVSCRIQGNSGTVGTFYSSVGGAYISGCSARIADTLIAGNRGLWVGGLILLDGQVPDESARIDSCTITGNWAWDYEETRDDEVGGLHSSWYNKLEMSNTVIWGNSPFVDAAAAGINSANTNASLVEEANLGAANLDGSQVDGSLLFVMPKEADAAPTLGGVYALASTSALLEEGDSDLLLADISDLDGDGDSHEDLPWDLAGNSRQVGNLDVGAFEKSSSDAPTESIADFRSSFGLSVDGANDTEDWSGHGVENALYFAFGVADQFGTFPTKSDEEAGTLGLPVFVPTDTPGKMKLVYSKSDQVNVEVISQMTSQLGSWQDVSGEGVERRSVVMEGGEIVVEEFPALESGAVFYRVKVVLGEE